MHSNAPDEWTRWPSRCVGGGKPWQRDTMGTVFKEDTQIHKHTLNTRTRYQSLLMRGTTFVTTVILAAVFKGPSELYNIGLEDIF